MYDSDENSEGYNPETEGPEISEDAVTPSWKPLLWLIGCLTLVFGLWELFLDLGANILEIVVELLDNIWLVLIEAPEEWLEDKIADWLKHHFPHDAYHMSEVTTAVGLLLPKILLVYFLVRWLWTHSKTRLLPRFRRWAMIRVIQVKLAWQNLAWPIRWLVGLLVIGVLVILI